MKWIIFGSGVALTLHLTIQPVFGNAITNGPTGINAAGLGLTGAGISIGQVEPGRPGLPGFDAAGNVHMSVVPTAVFRQNGLPNVVDVDAHAEQVAGIMISTDAMLAGVAPDAQLFASADNGTPPDFDPESAISAQHVATRNGGDIRAINMSFGNPLVGTHILDGNQLLTQFVDWSASHHDVLYVVAGNEGTMIPIPTDNFNGMTIGASERVGGTWRRVGAVNTFGEDAEGERTSIALIAPGDGFEMTDLGTMPTMPPHPDGTSFAAPHVTGTLALLQEHAEARILAGAPNWGPNARRHEVMKAVLMNSADKLIDDGTVMVGGNPVEQGDLLGMSRTIVKQDGTSTWLDSFAYDDTAFEGLGQSEPLDVEMGTGQLNASRAQLQFLGGEFDSDGADVPVIGWDYGTTTGEDDFNRYRFGAELRGGSFISITLAWDRNVEFDVDADMDGEYDVGDTFEPYVDDGFSPPDDTVINDLELHLMPKNAANLGQAIAQSDAKVGTVEHIFFQIPETGEYEIWVRQFDQEDFSASQDYAVAWWGAAVATPIEMGDYNGDTVVDIEDYNLWVANFGSMTNLDADGNGNGIVDAADYTVWRDNLGAMLGRGTATVPEPAGFVLLAIAGVLFSLSRKRRD